MTETKIDITEIMKSIPHRYPFLLVDKIIDLKKSESAIGIKNVTINEQFFQGHFPSSPVMPGVLIIEALAQTAGVLVCKSTDYSPENHLMYFTKIEEVRFKKMVVPGDQLVMKVKIDGSKMGFWKITAEAFIDDISATTAKFSVKIMPRENA
jgi:3-hydroxyacyl-[acyl-carrier-protein] dehydratase